MTGNVHFIPSVEGKMSYMSVTGEFEYGLSDGQVIYIYMYANMG